MNPPFTFLRLLARRMTTVIVLAFTVLAAREAGATVAVSNFFASHMVLQRDGPMKIYGTAAPKEIVKATLHGSTAAATADARGNWLLTLPPQSSGGPYTLLIAGKTNSISLTDVMIGDVWVAVGQSNMFFRMGLVTPGPAAVLNYQSEIAAANYPNLRLFGTDFAAPVTEAAAVTGTWAACTPASVTSFSAVAYYFARKVQVETGVPIGIVVSAKNATHAWAWMDQPTLASLGLSGGTPGDLAPGNCFNGMLAPLTRTAIKGFIYYQGEADADAASLYTARLEALISDWRGRWKNQKLPFYYVQLPNFDPTLSNPPIADNCGAWGKLRLAQAAALSVPLTGMISAVDVGIPAQLHPNNKKPVGERLAALALQATYGRNIVATGPTYAGNQISGQRVVVSYLPASLGGGLTTSDGLPPVGFDLAGSDGVFYPAVSAIDGTTVVLTCASVSAPQSVRYAWGNNPTVTLHNVEGYPAPPFLTSAVPPDSCEYPLGDPTVNGQDGNQGHWQLNGDGLDLSGNAHTLYLFNNPQFSSHAQEGAASLVLDGVKQYGDAFAYTMGSQFTISAWINPTGGGSDVQTILSNSVDNGSYGFHFCVSGLGAGKGRLSLRTSTDGNPVVALSSPGAVVAGTWQYVAVAVDTAAGTARFYVNDADKTDLATTAIGYATGGDIRVGCSGAGTDFYQGQIDDIVVSTGTLTLAQVQGLTIDNLAARWCFELDGADNTGHGNALTPVNGATYAPGGTPEGKYCAQLGGNGEYFDAGLQDLGSAYTVSMWVKTPAGIANDQTLAANLTTGSAGSATSGFALRIKGTGLNAGKLAFVTSDGSAAATLTTLVGLFAPGAWNHVAVTVDNTIGKATIYFHGEEIPVTGSMLADAATKAILTFGAQHDGSAPLLGNLDDVRIYKRALTAVEVARLSAVDGSRDPTGNVHAATGK